MTEAEQRKAATDFSNYWKGKGDEKSDCQRFWIDFCGDVLGIENVTQKLVFEKRVNVDGNTKFIDVYIPETRTLIEQKSIGVDMTKQYQQSGGWMATPYQQGRRYSQFLPVDETARWIIACNFETFEIHDMNRPADPPVIVELDEVRHKLPLFDFMFRKEVRELSREMEISVKAGEIVGILYDKLIAQYKDPDEHSFKSLNALCVRLVFCLYAEDAGIFGSHLMFHDYLKDIPVSGFRRALVELFKILDTKVDERDKYLAEDNPRLAAFPYVNGGLFADESIEIPPFTEEIKSLLLDKASADFDWSDISPTIFGAVFESTLNPETRRSGGMHYTSIENIHKVTDPLFMDNLRNEFENIMGIAVERTRRNRLEDFQKRIASLKFLDPACGSGNFLTETYISLRRLENEIINALQGGQMVLGEAVNPIRVSISQFYGIEINDFAVTVAKTALWIAESQMMKETEEIVHMNLDFLPLKSYANIIEGNALRIDWESVVGKNELDYIMGNPPFVGARLMDARQKEELLLTFGEKWKNAGNLDYVCCWYKLATDYIFGTKIRAALVSTNSVSQGETVANLWEPLFEMGVHIDFAHRSFRWDSEAKTKAHVHCVIIGFSTEKNPKEKTLYSDTERRIVRNINAYLLDAENVFVGSRNKPLCNVPEIGIGNKPIDDGNYLFTKDEMEDFIKKEPAAQKWFKPWIGSHEFINRYYRYCLWLGDCPPNELRRMPECMKRVQAVREFRLASKSLGTVKLAERPTRFHVENMPDSNYIVVPEVSSERRRYVPIGFMTPDILCSNLVKIIPDATLYHFGVLTSNVHMAWMRTVCGRLKSDYRYSKDVVYNNFPWPTPTEQQKSKIEQTAQEILDARAMYPDSSLADLYDELTMPPELRKAHTQNDKAVMQAYGFTFVMDNKRKWFSEEECVTALLKMYRELTE